MNNTAALLPASARVENACLADRIAPVLNEISAGARDTEKSGRVPARNIDLLRSVGYFDIVKPARFGGDEGSFAELVDANIELSSACASTGWVAGLLSAHQWLLAMFDERVQQEVWGSNPDALLCGSYAPVRMAERVEGGFRLSGDWAFASGCENAQWALCAAIIPANGEGERPVPAFLLVPASDYAIAETWDVVGLAGTGSKSLTLKNVFVPEYRMLSFPDATSGRTPGGRGYRGIGLFNIPLLMGVPFCLGSAAVGAAKGALESYIDHMGARVTRGAVAGGNNKIAEFPTIQLRVAEAPHAWMPPAKSFCAILPGRSNWPRPARMAPARSPRTIGFSPVAASPLRSAWLFGPSKLSMHRQAASASRCPTPSSGHGAMQMPSGAIFP